MRQTNVTLYGIDRQSYKASLLAYIVAVLIVGLQLTGCNDPPDSLHAAPIAPTSATSETDLSAVEQQWGIEVVRIKLTAADYSLIFAIESPTRKRHFLSLIAV